MGLHSGDLKAVSKVARTDAYWVAPWADLRVVRMADWTVDMWVVLLVVMMVVGRDRQKACWMADWMVEDSDTHSAAKKDELRVASWVEWRVVKTDGLKGGHLVASTAN